MRSSPFDSGFTAMQALVIGTVAKVNNLIAIAASNYRKRFVVMHAFLRRE
jgi:hypothetical protein